MKQIIAVVMLSALAAGMSASAGAEVPAVANALTPEQGVIVAGRLAPKDIVFDDHLPHNSSGKVMRRVLKARALGLPEGDLSTLERSG